MPHIKRRCSFMEDEPDFKASSIPTSFFDELEGDADFGDSFEEEVPETFMELPADWENVYVGDARTEGVHADSPADALILSLTTIGKVDIEFMACITGMDYKEVIASLRYSIYQNPLKWDCVFYEGWETAEEYLSGNIYEKWKIAREANDKFQGLFQDNVEALAGLLPGSLMYGEIYVTLGSPWVPVDVINDFITYLMDSRAKYEGTYHDEETGSWELRNVYTCYNWVKNYVTYGTAQMEAFKIIENSLNMKPIVVTKEVRSNTTKSGTRRVVDRPATIAATEKQRLIVETFQKWIWEDEERKERLVELYTNQYATFKRRLFNGSFLTFPGLSESEELRDYQKNAVARILFSPNTLLAHDVGSGKTYVMICAAMELRRMGLSKKNLFVVPNNIVAQWAEFCRRLYPTGKVLVVEHSVFTKDKQQETLRKIRDEDFDFIIMAYSCFDRIPVSISYKVERMKEEKQILDIQLTRAKHMTKVLKRRVDILEKEIQGIEEELQKMEDSPDICFEDLGITRLFVDEAHNYKNITLETQTDNIRGISKVGSKKADAMLLKVRCVQSMNDGGGVVFATGTPICNSLTDVYTMQLYLQEGTLALLDLQSFDSWIGMFGEKVTDFEIDVDTNSYRLTTRFSKFHNLQELTSLLCAIADFHQNEGVEDLPVCDGYTDVLVPKTPELQAFLKVISKRADACRNGAVHVNEDNLLKITTDGRKAALDLRLVDEQATFNILSKVQYCCDQVANIYFNPEYEGLTQLVFCDTSTPKEGFNVYDELKRLLVGAGIPDEEIAFIHDAQSEKQRLALFESMNRGEIRILIGSTPKLGLGVNIQNKLIALHHLDVPWRPADMVQREGRILRQGNQNKKVLILRYITSSSFDAYSWQLLEIKQRFISRLLSGTMSERQGQEVENVVLSYAEVKALAVGNPRLKERCEVQNELTRLLTLQKQALDTRIELAAELQELPQKIQAQKLLAGKAQEDAAHLDAYLKIHEIEVPLNTKDKAVVAQTRKVLREWLQKALLDNTLKEHERCFLTYRGFDVVLPMNMIQEKPHIWIAHGGKYYIELGEDPVGNFVRIDNFIDEFPNVALRYEAEYQKMQQRIETIRYELDHPKSYASQIEEVEIHLHEIDHELGVDDYET